MASCPVIAPGPGDHTTPVNAIPPAHANVVPSVVRVTAGGAVTSNAILVPDYIGLSVNVLPANQVVYELAVHVTNRAPDAVALAVDVGRLPGIVLVHEAHIVDDVGLDPRVELAAAAAAKYAAAAQDPANLATISSAGADFFRVQVAAVPAGAVAKCTLAFMQVGGVRAQEAVVANSAAAPARLADFVALAPRLPPGVALSMNVIVTVVVHPDAAWCIELPDAEVVSHDKDTYALLAGAGAPMHVEHLRHSGSTYGGAIVAKWCHRGAPAAGGTVVKARLRGPAIPAPAPPSETMPGTCIEGDVKRVDLSDGHSVSLVTMQLGPAGAGAATAAALAPVVVVIADVSGSTSACIAPGRTFQDEARRLVADTLACLPAHVTALRAAGHLGDASMEVRLWVFDMELTEIGVAHIGAGAHAVSAPDQGLVGLVAQARAFAPPRGTRLETWARKLGELVREGPARAYIVLLVTDGGAEDPKAFLRGLRDLKATLSARGGFLQIDCVGYGACFDARVVAGIARATGGRALLVHDPTGLEASGLVAHSLVRATTVAEVVITGGARVLCVANAADASPHAPPPLGVRVGPGAKPTTFVRGLPGDRVRICTLHATSADHLGAGVAPAPAIAPAPAPAASFVDRLATDADAAAAVEILAVLDPQLLAPGSYVLSGGAARGEVACEVSLKAQVPAPSFTRTVAVADAAVNIEPVPDHLAPHPGNLRASYPMSPPPQRRVLTCPRAPARGMVHAGGGAGYPGGASMQARALDEEEEDAVSLGIVEWTKITKGGLYAGFGMWAPPRAGGPAGAGAIIDMVARAHLKDSAAKKAKFSDVKWD